MNDTEMEKLGQYAEKKAAGSNFLFVWKSGHYGFDLFPYPESYTGSIFSVIPDRWRGFESWDGKSYRGITGRSAESVKRSIRRIVREGVK